MTQRSVLRRVFSKGICRAALVLAGSLACSSGASDAVAPPGSPAAIAITPNAPAVTLGSQLALQAQVRDASGQLVAGASVFWSSSDTTVAAVSSAGVVTGKSVGSVQIAASSGGQSAVVPLQVVPVAVATVAIAPSSASVTVGGTAALKFVAYDAAGNTLSGRTAVWASSAPQIATVDSNGTVTGIAAGTATITATSEGKTGSSTVTVAVVPVANVSISPGSAALAAGQSASFSATATDANGNVLNGRQFTWASANASVATVSQLGLVTATGPGSTTISATTEGKTGSAQVVVTSPAPAPVASVTVTPASATVSTGSTVTLTATMRDANGATLSGRAVTWSSSSPQTATVSSTGVVTGVSPGSATITATSEGKSGTAAITVPQPTPAPVARVTVSPSTLSLAHYQNATLTAQLTDANGNVITGRTITWASSDTTKVTVTGSGSTVIVSASTHNGNATITATSGGASGTASVTVH